MLKYNSRAPAHCELGDKCLGTKKMCARFTGEQDQRKEPNIDMLHTVIGYMCHLWTENKMERGLHTHMLQGLISILEFDGNLDFVVDCLLNNLWGDVTPGMVWELCADSLH